jgi:nitroimidazol reductase NimA-like FMN-containing flavoprotein (pyridoxamine 5'-phosphate oxidase superfamily)
MLNEAEIGRLSMADRNGRPYTIPLPFCRAGGAIYLRLPLSGRKDDAGGVLGPLSKVAAEILEDRHRMGYRFWWPGGGASKLSFPLLSSSE